jgi:hypothetical protein
VFYSPDSWRQCLLTNIKLGGVQLVCQSALPAQAASYAKLSNLALDLSTQLDVCRRHAHPGQCATGPGAGAALPQLMRKKMALERKPLTRWLPCRRCETQDLGQEEGVQLVCQSALPAQAASYAKLRDRTRGGSGLAAVDEEEDGVGEEAFDQVAAAAAKEDFNWYVNLPCLHRQPRMLNCLILL